MNDTKQALSLIHQSLVDINQQLARLQAGIEEQARREEKQLRQAERKIDALAGRVQRLERPASY